MAESTAEKITNWIKGRTEAAGAKGAVIGLSGGIDSSVTAILCKKALGNNVLGVLMPCQSNEKDYRDAQELASKFDIKTEKIDLTPIYNNIVSFFPEGNNIATANIKPRLRMITLYYFSNSMNCIVAGTGNKTELMVGYFTKYGDGGVDILPLGDLYKRQVYEIAHEIGVPENILKKTPSAGLWEGQTDEGELGISYDDLDNILSKIENKEDLSGFDNKTLEKIKNLMEKNRHKIEPSPIFKI